MFNLASILIYAGMTMRNRLWGAAWPPPLCCASDALCRCSCEQRGEGGSEPGLISHRAPALQQHWDSGIDTCTYVRPLSAPPPIRLTSCPWARITFLFRSVTHQERQQKQQLRFSRCLHLVTRRDLAVNPIISHRPFFLMGP